MSKIAAHVHSAGITGNDAAEAVRAFSAAWGKFPAELRQRVWDLSVREDMEAVRKRARAQTLREAFDELDRAADEFLRACGVYWLRDRLEAVLNKFHKAK